MRRIAASVALTATCLLALAACGGQPTSSAGTATASTSSLPVPASSVSSTPASGRHTAATNAASVPRGANQDPFASANASGATGTAPPSPAAGQGIPPVAATTAPPPATVPPTTPPTTTPPTTTPPTTSPPTTTHSTTDRVAAPTTTTVPVTRTTTTTVKATPADLWFLKHQFAYHRVSNAIDIVTEDLIAASAGNSPPYSSVTDEINLLGLSGEMKTRLPTPDPRLTGEIKADLIAFTTAAYNCSQVMAEVEHGSPIATNDATDVGNSLYGNAMALNRELIDSGVAGQQLHIFTDPNA